MTIKNIAVIGAGTMGNGIAHVFAQNNFSVNLIDVSQDQLDKAINTIKKNLDRQVSKNIISEEIKNKTISNISTVTSLKNGVQNAGLVIEAATENTDLKLKIFKDLDEAAPAAGRAPRRWSAGLVALPGGQSASPQPGVHARRDAERHRALDGRSGRGRRRRAVPRPRAAPQGADVGDTRQARQRQDAVVLHEDARRVRCRIRL